MNIVEQITKEKKDAQIKNEVLLLLDRLDHVKRSVIKYQSFVDETQAELDKIANGDYSFLDRIK